MTSINISDRDKKKRKGRISGFCTILSLRWILVCSALIPVLVHLSYIGPFATNSNCYTDVNEQKRIAPVDKDALDCRAMLQRFRQGKVTEMEEVNGYEKSYVTRTDTLHPFYWATHSGVLDNVRKSSFETGHYYEKQLTERIAESFKSDKKAIFLDVGGNIGWFSLLAASHGAKVYTFEPNPANLVRICESMALNGWLHNDDANDAMVVIPKGVGDEITTQSFYRVTANNPGSFTFDETKSGNVAKENRTMGQFDIVTLDSFAEQRGWLDVSSNQPSIAFFKLDVEGFEAKVMKGARKLFQSKIIQKFAMEMKGHSESDILLITEILFTCGYELYMHGGYLGPANIVQKQYGDYKELANDISGKVYSENLLFRLASK